MIDKYTELKKELKVHNPDITEKELNDAAVNIVNLYILANEIVNETLEEEPFSFEEIG